MASVVHLAIPGAGPLVEVLSTISQLSGAMEEGKYVCGHLHSGLVCIMDGLQAKEDDGLPPKESLDRFVTVVVKFLRYLNRHQGKEMVNEAIVELFELFDVVMVNWKEQWEHNVRVNRDVLIASAKDNGEVLRHVRDPRDQVEALLTLKLEVEQRAAQHEREILECCKSMIITITEASRVTTKDLPPWFIPLHDVRFESKPFGRGSFGSVHSAVWGPGTKVVIK
ncbi:hypothetical protein PHPALM_29642 [Phytophthora palmivora]|uniref:Serine/threonine protein kinase n=1 Tax=Phytophthora palmivora TaxID=4796 RepID=A0A2P4X725_9STRA|nr:hypothetical protein PHPALM_29642 [Phytophthora palmivora]